MVILYKNEVLMLFIMCFGIQEMEHKEWLLTALHIFKYVRQEDRGMAQSKHIVHDRDIPELEMNLCAHILHICRHYIYDYLAPCEKIIVL